MHVPEAYVGSEERLRSPHPEKETREILQNVLSRCRLFFYRVAYRQLGNAADAEDAVQDALRAATSTWIIQGQAQMSTWLTAIVTNCARMQLRRRPRQTHLRSSEQFQGDGNILVRTIGDRGPSPEDECWKSRTAWASHAIAAELFAPLRKAFQLRDLDGLTTSEAARISGRARRNGEGPARKSARQSCGGLCAGRSMDSLVRLWPATTLTFARSKQSEYGPNAYAPNHCKGIAMGPLPEP